MMFVRLSLLATVGLHAPALGILLDRPYGLEAWVDGHYRQEAEFVHHHLSLSGTVAHSGWQGHWQAAQAASGPHLTPAAGRLATAPLRCDDDSVHAGMLRLLLCTASDHDVQVCPSLNHGRVVSIMPRRAGCLWDLGFA
jgi:hypothetical protein